MKKMINKEAIENFYYNNPILNKFFEESEKEYVEWLNFQREEWKKIEKEIEDEKISSIRYELRLKKTREFGCKFVIDFVYDKDWDKKVTEYVKKQIEAQKETFYNRIADKVGNIEKIHLKTAIDGTVEGTIKGDKTTVSINVIGAGGFNVQRFHFRTLIKVVKN